jgi:beta-ketoacyl ACP synthase
MSIAPPDIVVTGVAMTTALAPDAEHTWQCLLDGRCGIRDLSDSLPRDVDLPTRMGGALLEDLDSELTRVELRRLSYLQKLALVLSRRAWENCGSPDVDQKRLAVSIGTGFGSNEELLGAYDGMQQRGLRGVSPLAVQMFMPNGAAAAVGLDRGARAGVSAPMAGDVSSSVAIAQAWQQIVLGEADMVICGGVESPVERVPLASYGQMDGFLATDDSDPARACRPFDRSRTGMVLGEGAGLLVLESEAHATARGATVLARLLGAAMTSDGYHAIFNDPTGDRASDAVARALQLARLAPNDIDHVNAHAAGTTVGDLAEAAACERIFDGARPAVYAPKAALGHSFGAAGAVEAILTVFALRDGIVPPTLNLTELDPRIDLDVVTGRPREGDYRYAVSNSFGFGGHNVALAFGKA